MREVSHFPVLSHSLASDRVGKARHFAPGVGGRGEDLHRQNRSCNNPEMVQNLKQSPLFRSVSLNWTDLHHLRGLKKERKKWLFVINHNSPDVLESNKSWGVLFYGGGLGGPAGLVMLDSSFPQLCPHPPHLVWSKRLRSGPAKQPRVFVFCELSANAQCQTPETA